MTTESEIAVISHRGILIVMAVLVAIGSLAGFVLAGPAFGFGVLFGGAMSFLNYIWLKRSTRAIFDQTAGSATWLLAAKYVFRYAAMGLVLLAVYKSGLLPLAAVILGLGAFAFAVVLQGMKNIFSSSI